MCADLPLEVMSQVDGVIDSLDALEIAVCMFREPGRAWTADELAHELALRDRVVRRTMARMLAKGLVRATNGEESGQALRIAPERASFAAAIVELYASRRVDLINHIASRALKRIQAIADSFRLRHPGRQEGAAAGAEDDREERRQGEVDGVRLIGVPSPAR